MPSTRDIRNRFKAIDNIERITRTMQLIATSKFQVTHRRAVEARPFTTKVAELVSELSAAAGNADLEHPLLQSPSPSPGRSLLLVITSNRGLCGGYNASVLRAAAAQLDEQAATETGLEVSGRRGVSYFRFTGVPVAATHDEIGDPPLYENVNALAVDYIDRFTAGEFDTVRVAYMQFESASRQQPRVLTLLPIQRPESNDAAAERGPAVNYDFSPDPNGIMAELLPITVKTQLFQCFNDASVSEQSARMIAMKNATDNAAEMGRLLTRQYNRARQAQITTELSEIVTGAEALA